MHEAVPAIAACGVSPLVRIPDMQSWMVKRKSKIVEASGQELLLLTFLFHIKVCWTLELTG